MTITLQDLQVLNEKARLQDQPIRNWGPEEVEYAYALVSFWRSGGRELAERYQWLREHFRFANDSLQEIWFDESIAHSALKDQAASDLDAAIDAAREKEEKP
jgi:hypothetical protein